MNYLYLPLLLLTLGFCSCQDSEDRLIANNVSASTIQSKNEHKRELSEEFKGEWYEGDAEITTYTLTQERYGELRDGLATMIFVTESMNPELQVKADRPTDESTPVLKLNMTKKFITGIYPYSIMTSVFNPTSHQGHALKVSHSVQEWCGQVYTQLNNRNRFEVNSHSYFETEGDEEFTLPITWLEDELWNRIRINPNELPTGELEVIPSLEFARLRHVDLQAYVATGTLEQRDSISTYELSYPELKRKLTIHFNSSFPFHIERWEETHANGMQTKAVVKKRIRTPYWQQNRLEDQSLRDSLGFE